MTFVLHPRLEADSAFIIDLPLSQARLSLNAAFPWIILVPRAPELVEIMDLSLDYQQQLLQEIDAVSRILKTLFNADKLNIGALGNIVPQLHIHVIARYTSDPAWPNPVWNSGVSKQYSEEETQSHIENIAAALKASIY
jgi:diadenosine tetraphosphate (Ap4A) HIT family hydrolase